MIKKYIVFLVVLMLAFVLIPGCGQENAQGLYEQAEEAYESFRFSDARQLYQKARKKAVSESDNVTETKCRERLWTLECYYIDYPYDPYQVKSELKKTYPDVPESERNSWIKDGKLESIEVDGEARYLSTSPENVAFRDMDLFHDNEEMTEGYNNLVNELYVNFVRTPHPPEAPVITNPASWKGIETITVPREKLPDKGELQIWIPVPVTTEAQPVAIVSLIEPTEYIKHPPVDGNIGDVYLEIELEKLKGDLEAKAEFLLTHMEQNYHIDPKSVGEYDEDDDDYKKYTRSYGNTEITPEITAMAEEIAGEETNPYLIAKKIYDYIVENVTYSFVPECTYWPRGKPVSVYVHENECGDCGGQSIYFSALCRSQGIPARATGGWQLFTGEFQTHFWAEFYLPNYGWVPVDTSVGQMADYTTNMNEEQKREFKDYYFGNLDNLRCVIQKDVDTPLVPAPEELTYSPGALQAPDALCDTMKDVPATIIDKYWNTEAIRLQ